MGAGHYPYRHDISPRKDAGRYAAGLEPRDFAGHSLRAGMVTSAAESGVSEWRIRMTSRHKSDVLRQYIRPVEKRQHALTSDIGL